MIIIFMISNESVRFIIKSFYESDKDGHSTHTLSWRVPLKDQDEQPILFTNHSTLSLRVPLKDRDGQPILFMNHSTRLYISRFFFLLQHSTYPLPEPSDLEIEPLKNNIIRINLEKCEPRWIGFTTRNTSCWAAGFTDLLCVLFILSSVNR